MSVAGAASSHPKRKRSSTEQVVPGSEYPTENGNFARRRASRDASRSARPVTPFEDPNYPIPNFDKVYEQMRHPTKGLKVADRRWRLISYTKCFVGTEAVQWMVDNLSVDKKTAISLGQRLMDAGIIRHVTQSEPFSDKYYFFRFQEDDDTNVLNMKRVWDPKIQTRPAVTVSQDLLTQLACLCEEYRARFIAARNIAVSDAKPETPETADLAKKNRSEPTSEDPLQGSADPGETPPLPQSSAPSQSLATGILSSPLLGAIPRNIINTLSPYATNSGSPNLMSIQKTITQARDSGSGDDIDYSLLAKSEAFRQYTLAAAELQHVQLVGLTDDELLAVFVNLYNTLCLHGYVVHGPPSNFLRRWVFFRSLSYRVAGLDMTLDDIEHGILRGNKRPPMIMLMQQLRPSDPKCQYVLSSRDGRIHFVISAGTRSDPPVRILNGENLQEELHEATVEFLGCSVKVDMERNVVTLPRIFLWYPDDFPTPETALLKWVSKYLPVQRSDQLRDMVSKPDSKPTVVYESFDWNSAEARFEASVIRRKRRKLARECAPQGSSNQNPFLDSPCSWVPPVAQDGVQPDQMLTTPLLASHPLLLRQSQPHEEGDAQSVTVDRPLTSESRLSDIQFPMPPMPAFLHQAGSEIPVSRNPAEETSPTGKEE